ncbi:putative AMP-binding protein [Yersinia rohdei]|nr:AMP-binding protein [Yersinia rohdei]CNE91762.1 putative AMP-binding protein [Yersinia rohdei]CNJ25275.1 putative AMP-binding protein [Yersinia rohdei]CQJ52145.1 putative AMP-binding protein [Yersinia rohdei]
MDYQEEGSTTVNLAMANWLDHSRDDALVIAMCGTKSITLNQLRCDVAYLSHKMTLLPNMRWALCFENSYWFTVALLATLYCKKTPVIFGHAREAVLKEQLHEFDGMLTDQQLNLECPRIMVTGHVSPEAIYSPLPNWPSDASLILFTSGSTGAPKAVVKSIEGLDIESHWLAMQWGRYIDRANNPLIVASVSHQHLYGLTFRIFLPLSLGIPFQAELIGYHEQLQFLPECCSPIFISSPAFLKRLDVKLPPIQCQQIFSAGGPLSFHDAQSTLAVLGILPTEIYGATETGLIAHRQQFEPQQPWQFFSGITLDINSDNTFTVYSALIPESTGMPMSDIIELSDDGQGFHLLGRQDRIVKIEEKRVSLTEIEQRLLLLPDIADATVLLLTQNERVNIAAVVVLTDAGKEQLCTETMSSFNQKLRSALRNWLEPASLPRRVRVIDVIPVNPQGKRDYARLQELFL